MKASAPAPCNPLTANAAVVECYDLDAVALVEAGSAHWRDLVKEDRAAFDGGSTLALGAILLALAITVAIFSRRNK